MSNSDLKDETSDTPDNPLPAAIGDLEQAIGRVIVGQQEVVRQVLTAAFCGGHVLLEGITGLGKTLLVHTLAAALELEYKRIHFTPDLDPEDIIGTTAILHSDDGDRDFRFRRGPLFTQALLADEITRATPRTQSALLEAMQEASVTVAGHTYRLPQPFFVLATQSPLETAGTYPLPEGQLDRFMFKIKVPFPNLDELSAIIDYTTGNTTVETDPVMDGARLLELRELVRAVPLSEAVKTYALRLVLATHPGRPEATEVTRRFVTVGASPRGAQALILGAKFGALMAGRDHVDYDDVRQAILPALRHRIILGFEAGAADLDADDALTKIVEEVEDIPAWLREEALG